MDLKSAVDYTGRSRCKMKKFVKLIFQFSCSLSVDNFIYVTILQNMLIISIRNRIEMMNVEYLYLKHRFILERKV